MIIKLATKSINKVKKKLPRQKNYYKIEVFHLLINPSQYTQYTSS